MYFFLFLQKTHLSQFIIDQGFSLAKSEPEYQLLLILV